MFPSTRIDEFIMFLYSLSSVLQKHNTDDPHIDIDLTNKTQHIVDELYKIKNLIPTNLNDSVNKNMNDTDQEFVIELLKEENKSLKKEWIEKESANQELKNECRELKNELSLAKCDIKGYARVQRHVAELLDVDCTDGSWDNYIARFDEAFSKIKEHSCETQNNDTGKLSATYASLNKMFSALDMNSLKCDCEESEEIKDWITHLNIKSDMAKNKIINLRRVLGYALLASRGTSVPPIYPDNIKDS